MSSKNQTYTAMQKKSLAYTTLFVVIFAIWFLRSYFSMFVIAGTLAYLFYPLYSRLRKKFHENTAATLTLVSSFLVILIPLLIVVLLAGNQLKNLSNEVAAFFASLDTTRLANNLIESTNRFLEHLPFSVQPVSSARIIDAAQKLVVSLGSSVLGGITHGLTSFLGLFSAFIIYLFMFISLLKKGPHLLEMFRKINPLGGKISELYIHRTGAMVRGTVQGQFIIALTQGILGAVAVALAGYPNLFFVVFVVFTLLSIIPLGAGILAIPLGIFMILFGNMWGGLIVIGEHILINTNVDNVLRPILVPKEARLDAALMLVSVFAGIRLFGFLGIVIGPTLMILIVTTIQAYLEFLKNTKDSASL